MGFSLAIQNADSRRQTNRTKYGYDKLRFIRPVHIGDTIYTKIIIGDKQDDPKDPQFGRVVERLTVHNQRDEPVMATDHILRVRKRPTGAAS